MSVSTSVKHEWIIILPDHLDALEKRMKVRQKHFENLEVRKEQGFWKLGGALLNDVPKEGEPLKIMGSIMLAFASSKEEVVAALKDDPYYQSNVWDWDKAQGLTS